jgi:hypothetical protein
LAALLDGVLHVDFRRLDGRGDALGFLFDVLTHPLDFAFQFFDLTVEGLQFARSGLVTVK